MYTVVRRKNRESCFISWRGKIVKVVLLAGGFGTRISEESHLKPKPMIEIGEKPILWHIMKYYSQFGFHEFVICLGYKQYVVKEFFADYFLHTSDVTFDLANNQMEVHNNYSEPWKVTLVDTGLNTMTGGRVKRIRPFVGDEPFMLTYGDGVADVDLNALVRFHKNHGKIATLTSVNVGQKFGPFVGDEPFMLTYGDGVADVDLNALVRFHKNHGKIATLTSVNVGQKFGVLDLNGEGQVQAFREKNDNDGALINGGFMVLNSGIFDYLADDTTVLEKEPLENLAKDGQLMAYHHEGFWKCMDTQRDKQQLEAMWQSGKAPWKIWE